LMPWPLYPQGRDLALTMYEADRTPEPVKIVFGESKITIKIDPFLAYLQHSEKRRGRLEVHPHILNLGTR